MTQSEENLNQVGKCNVQKNTWSDFWQADFYHIRFLIQTNQMTPANLHTWSKIKTSFCSQYAWRNSLQHFHSRYCKVLSNIKQLLESWSGTQGGCGGYCYRHIIHYNTTSGWKATISPKPKKRLIYCHRQKHA